MTSNFKGHCKKYKTRGSQVSLLQRYVIPTHPEMRARNAPCLVQMLSLWRTTTDLAAQRALGG